MSAIEDIAREMRAARAAARKIVHVRITDLAPQGSIVALNITPEMARTVAKLYAFPGGTVDAGPEWETLVEVLIHPEDWAALLCSEHFAQHVAADGTRVMGIPVVQPFTPNPTRR